MSNSDIEIGGGKQLEDSRICDLGAETWYYLITVLQVELEKGKLPADAFAVAVDAMCHVYLSQNLKELYAEEEKRMIDMTDAELKAACDAARRRFNKFDYELMRRRNSR